MPPVIVGERGRYALGASLGSGGMASVHRGVELGTRRPVAIKRLHPHLITNAWVASRFREEAALARRLDHPNVAKVLDLAETEAGPALVLELYEGGALLALSYASWNRGDAVPRAVASAIVLDVLAALGAAHGLTKDGRPAPVVHRDVSPHNVLFGLDGVARLADFGVARATDKTDSTDTGSLRGKLSYMAPELFSGKRADPRSDLYGAGVMLWELLASERLFEGEVAEVVGKMLSADRASLALVPRGIPAELEAVVLRALAVDPSQRFKDAEVMAEALRAAAPPASRDEVAAWVRANALALPGETEVPVDEPPPSSLLETTRHPRRARPRARSRRPLFVGLGLAVTLAAGAAAFTALRERASGAELAPTDPAPAEPGAATASAAGSTSSAPQPTPSIDPRPGPSAAPSDAAPAASPAASTPRPAPSARAARSATPAKRSFDLDRSKAQVAYVMARSACPDTAEVLYMRVTLFPDGATTGVVVGSDPEGCVTIGFRSRFSHVEPFSGDAVSFTVGAAN